MGLGAEFTGAGRSVIGTGFALPRVPTGGRRSLACAPLRPVGARRNCIFTARGGVTLMGAGRRVISNGFALPRDADRRSAFPGLRAALPGGGSAQLHFHSKRWCGTHGGRASRHQQWFRAPARCRPEVGVPWPARRSARWGLGATAFSQQEVVCHLRWQGVASSAMVSRSRAMPVGDRRSKLSPRSFSFGSTRFRGPVGCGAGLKAPTGRTGGVPFHPRPVSGRAQVRSGSVMTSTRAGPSVASAVLKASVNCSARSTRMPRPPQSVA